MADEERLKAMAQKFVVRAREQAARLTELRALLAAETAMTADALNELKRLSHSLHGAGGTFGFAAISDAAGVAEDLVDDLTAAGTGPDAPHYAKLDAALGTLLDLIAHLG